jgi:hypothetical protein
MPTRRGGSDVEKGRYACIAPVAAHPQPLINGETQIRIVLDHKMTRAPRSVLVILWSRKTTLFSQQSRSGLTHIQRHIINIHVRIIVEAV